MGVLISQGKKEKEKEREEECDWESILDEGRWKCGVMGGSLGCAVIWCVHCPSPLPKIFQFPISQRATTKYSSIAAWRWK